MGKDYELVLTDLIDTQAMQRIQNDFSRMTGMSAVILDENGRAVTKKFNCYDFCKGYTTEYPTRCRRCEQCEMLGTELAREKGKFVVYSCHIGLTCVVAPIMAGEKMIGSIMGGCVLTHEIDTEAVFRAALESGVDPDDYMEAVQTVDICGQEKINNALKIIDSIAAILSDMAYNKYLVQNASEELEKTANMKSDFLANMSHEIRTPMNAVIGMAEMALREELPATARGYINQIKEAGKSLLTIINDILDFSKIESGKMDIIEVEYEPMSMVHDVANIVMTRLKEKNVELILDVIPDLPNKLMGDNIRIKQIITNIANNAAKFTSQGQIILKTRYANLSSGEIEMHVSVEDTGIGIRKEDMNRLFQSFQQVDSKRNRNIEGTGLGLAISKRLLTLMNGNIWVESEYEKGSKFSLIIPQKIVDPTPCITLKNPEGILVAGLISNPYINSGLRSDVAKLGAKYTGLQSWRDLAALPKDKKIYFFIEYPMFTEVVEGYVEGHPDITAILIVDFYDNVKCDIPNVIVVKKPVFALNIAMILNEEELHFEDDTEKGFDFVAPKADILIVDDNAVNLTVAEGLLEPLKMNVDTAVSGKAAVDKITKRHYDIIFMDHMMPELDGVETTHIIRRFHPEYNDVPIIALTANAVEGTREMFCREGMNDFVAKPIELRMLVSKVRQWLPPEKIQKVLETQIPKGSALSKDVQVGDLDISFALKFLGSEDLFWTVLKVYYHSIEKKAALIKSLEEREEWTGFTIEVHALKSSSKQIGAISLSEKAAALEKAGNAGDANFIHKRTDEMLKQYLDYIPVLEPFCVEAEEGNDGKESISDEKLRELFSEMREAVDNLDMDRMEEVIQEMNQYAYGDAEQQLFTQLKQAVEDVDVDGCETILQDWEGRL